MLMIDERGIIGTSEWAKTRELLKKLRKHSEETYWHSLRVGFTATQIAYAAGFDKKDIKKIMYAGYLHDIGKLDITKTILNKPGILTVEERSLINCHTKYGYEILKDMSFDTEILYAVLEHHERIDGSGYPYGISGDNISNYAKIVAIADVYDALLQKRSYKNAMTKEAVEHEMLKERKQYDDRYLEILLRKIKNISA